MDRQELIESIRAYQPFNEQEKIDKSLILDWIETQDDAFSRDNTVAHMTASAWVVVSYRITCNNGNQRTLINP